MKKITESQFQTNGQFKFNPNYQNGSPIDIHKTKSLEDLITIHSYLKSKSEQYESSAKDLGLKEFPIFKWQNYTWGTMEQ